MSWILTGCRRHREDLGLLAAGALTAQEAARAENHLAVCPACQSYFNEIKGVTGALGNWEQSLSRIEPDHELRIRWDQEFKSGTGKLSPTRPAFLVAILDWCRDMFWPCRRIWTGYAAAWLLIFAINLSTRDNPGTLAGNAARPSREVLRALLESEGFLAGTPRPVESQVAEPPKSAMPSRSERRPGFIGA